MWFPLDNFEFGAMIFTALFGAGFIVALLRPLTKKDHQ